jgi:hypothetical protein
VARKKGKGEQSQLLREEKKEGKYMTLVPPRASWSNYGFVLRKGRWTHKTDISRHW